VSGTRPVMAASRRLISSKELKNLNPNTSEANCESCVQILLRNRRTFIVIRCLKNWKLRKCNIVRYAPKKKVFECLKFHLIPRLYNLVTVEHIWFCFTCVARKYTRLKLFSNLFVSGSFIKPSVVLAKVYPF